MTRTCTVPVQSTSHLLGCALALGVLLSASGVRAEENPEKQRGVRGKVVVASELARTPVALSEARQKALETTAIVRRPVRGGRPLTEPPGALVVMLEGGGLRQQEEVKQEKLVIAGLRFSPASVVIPRASPITIENKLSQAITLEDEDGKPVGRLEVGGVGDFTLKAGAHVVRVKEFPFCTASVRVLERGRALPIVDSEIPLTDIPGGDYMLTFFLGSEPLRVQPLTVPDAALVFIDATVSQKGVVDVTIKDASQRVALPPTGVPKDQGTPAPPQDTP